MAGGLKALKVLRILARTNLKRFFLLFGVHDLGKLSNSEIKNRAIVSLMRVLIVECRVLGLEYIEILDPGSPGHHKR